LSLYLKYRPKDFDNLIGQEHIKTTLLNALKEKKISHAYLFCGPRGTGKTTTARLIAKSINCQNPLEFGHHCNECFTCKSAQEGSLVDLIEIDAASNRGIDEIRDLREKIRFAPSQARAKVYIIDEVHMLTKEAFNALLKTLEEPPAHAYFILATTETHKVPATIISRCQKFDFHRIAIAELVNRLKYIAEQENLNYEEEAMEQIAKSVKGGLRDAISILDQLSSEGNLTLDKVKKSLGISDIAAIENLFQSLIDKNAIKGLAIINQIYQQGLDLNDFARTFLEYLRQKMIEAVNANSVSNLNLILSMIEIFSQAKLKINSSVIPQLPLEIAVMEICHRIPDIKAQSPNPNNLDKNNTHHGNTQNLTNKMADQHPTTSNPQSIMNNQPLIGPSDSPLPLTPSDLLNKWEQILNLIDPPAIRQSLKQSNIKEIKDSNITLIFNTAFHFEKFNKAAHICSLENAIKQIFDTEAKVTCSLEKPAENSEQSPIDKTKEAMDIFGGQW